MTVPPVVSCISAGALTLSRRTGASPREQKLYGRNLLETHLG